MWVKKIFSPEVYFFHNGGFVVGGWILSVYAVVIKLQITAQNSMFELFYLLFLVYYDHTYLIIATIYIRAELKIYNLSNLAESTLHICFLL